MSAAAHLSMPLFLAPQCCALFSRVAFGFRAQRYYYSRDKNPGGGEGHGVGNAWHVRSARGSPMTNPGRRKFYGFKIQPAAYSLLDRHI